MKNYDPYSDVSLNEVLSDDLRETHPTEQFTVEYGMQNKIYNDEEIDMWI